MKLLRSRAELTRTPGGVDDDACPRSQFCSRHGSLQPNATGSLLVSGEALIVQRASGVVEVVGEIVIRHGTTTQACEEFLKRFPRHDGGVFVYGDASGNQQQTSGGTDYDMIRDHFAVHANMKVEYRVPKANPSVRERINLTNRELKTAAGQIGLLVDAGCKELIKDLEQVCYKADTNQIDKDRDRLLLPPSPRACSSV